MTFIKAESKKKLRKEKIPKRQANKIALKKFKNQTLFHKDIWSIYCKDLIADDHYFVSFYQMYIVVF
jgi:hypothetical protein